MLYFHEVTLVKNQATTPDGQETIVVDIENNCQGPLKSLFYMPFTDAEVLWNNSSDKNSYCSAEK